MPTEQSVGTGLMAEFTSDAEIVSAAQALVALGYRELDAFTPRPIEALQDALALKRSTLPRTVFLSGFCGGAIALAGQWFCNAWLYPLNVGGRPPFSAPAFIPITFEMTVLFAGLAAFFGVLHRSGLPRLAHPVFAVPNFARASDDRFWLFVDVTQRPGRAPEAEQVLQDQGCVSLVKLDERGAVLAEAAKQEP